MRKLSAASALNGQANVQNKCQGDKEVALQLETEDKATHDASICEASPRKADGHISENEEDIASAEDLASVSLISGRGDKDSETRL